MKFATMFSGGGGADVGLMAAGLQPTWAIEYDREIAGVYRDNIGDHVLVGDVNSFDYSLLPKVDWLHASPVCTRASIANANANEDPLDLRAARAVAWAIEDLRPKVFTLENVWQYRDFKSFRLILNAIGDAGYFYDFENVNAADFGVPQTRKRLVLRAVHGGLVPFLPEPVRWVSWYDAIEDLIPTLPASKLAPWQAARIPDSVKSLLFGNHPHTASGARSYVPEDESVMTISSQYIGRARAVLVGNQARDGVLVNADQDRPAFTITAAANQYGNRAVLVSPQTNNRFGNRAVLVDPNNGRLGSGEPHTVTDAEPAFAVRASRSVPVRAVLAEEQPRVVSMTARALARFQSFPDTYILPESKTLAAKVIGNAVPPLLMQRIAESILGAI